MNAENARQAVDYALNSFDGEPVYVDDSTIVIGMDSDSGRYWVADNGEEVTGLDYDGVIQFCVDALVKQAEYAETVYATPDEWGSQTVYADEPTMQTVIASLIDAGGEDWASINLGDCAEWELVQVVNGLGLYKQQHVRNDNYIALWDSRALPIKMATRLVDTMQEGDGYQEVYFSGMFGRRIATYSTLEDAIEELSK